MVYYLVYVTDKCQIKMYMYICHKNNIDSDSSENLLYEILSYSFLYPCGI